MHFHTQFIFFLLVVFALASYFIFVEEIDNSDVTILNSTYQCHIQPWNFVNTQSTDTSYLNRFSKWLWIKFYLPVENLHNNTEISILAAYVYPDHISITLITQHSIKKQLYCRYYDCKRNEIRGSAWLGTVFPESVIQCPRRIGAEFVSVSENLEKESDITPVGLTFRVFEEPIHELSVCVAPMYGNEPSWLPIIDFVEHNKLEGASYFYFYVGEIRDYDQKILDDYVRTGDIELVKLQDKYHRVFIAWHLLQIQDCHLRSAYHSKWTAFIDLDERLSTNGPGTMIDVLRSIQDSSVGEVQLQSTTIVKDQDYPDKYENIEQLEQELIFKKYNETVKKTMSGTKPIIKSEKIGLMSIHQASAKYFGVKTLLLNITVASVRLRQLTAIL
ncbi:Glycosyltransferase family 92 protein [Caenorhabditis elegans]|uniref:Glycosyltransferase family 92 protein n=1 Tax=Caenorhabditis elegans TaxID=6239 RepID=A0A078BTR2_CAEEL|nr:Glycosyltransferase family 92 protein [Caenorhabditis elegans]CDX47508.1 Glycosyltransferase family 92 protein [Caenorhabditis elegans]|eukprot:NP_001294127.1 Uncharacterized protein CELE_Y105C5B.25 [Caenorhabditis elegans]